MKALAYINHYSIDVALGAMISTMCFGQLLETALAPQTILLLGITVWLIYTFDHINDAKLIKNEAVALRHKLHQKHLKTLSLLMVFGLCLAAILIFYIPPSTLYWGISLLCIVGIYFIFLKLLNLRFSYYKEIVVACIYCAGILVAPLSITKVHLSSVHLMLLLQFGLIVISNLILFSLKDEKIDRKQRFPSIVIAIGKHRANILFWLAFILQLFILSMLLLLEVPMALTITLFVMGLVIVLAKAINHESQVYYRMLGDIVFIFPIILLF